MPELPEVQTTVNGLQRVLPGLFIRDVWSDFHFKNKSKMRDSLKSPTFYKKFVKAVRNKKILSVARRGKNILIHLSGGETILIHMKMTGHLLYGKYEKKNNKWIAPAGPMRDDPYNRHIHFVLSFSNGRHLAFSDARKFAKVTLLKTDELEKSKHLSLGPEPLSKSFTFDKFKKCLMRRPRGSIMNVLMDQSIIAGIGNIYSDEMLWLAGIHPESKPEKVKEEKLRLLYRSMKEVLKKGIKFGGDSTSDYRAPNGKRGKFQAKHNAYQKTGERCGKRGCNGVIIRSVIGGRSAHYCLRHQLLYK